MARNDRRELLYCLSQNLLQFFIIRGIVDRDDMTSGRCQFVANP